MPKTKTRAPAAPVPGNEGSSREEMLVARQAHLEQGKQHYELADELLAQILLATKRDGGSRRITHPLSGAVFEIVDNFARGKNKVWGMAGVKRYDLKPVKASKQPAAAT